MRVTSMTEASGDGEKTVPDEVCNGASIANSSSLTPGHINKSRVTARFKNPISDTFEGILEGTTQPWMIPPTVIQIPLQEAVGSDQRPHSKRRHGRQKKLPGNDKEEDLQNTTDKPVADKGPVCGGNRPPTLRKLKARKNLELYSRKTDANQHWERRHS